MELTPKHYGLGKIGYDAYCKQTGGKSLISGDPLPEFKALKPAIQDAWAAVGIALALNFDMVSRGMWPEASFDQNGD